MVRIDDAKSLQQAAQLQAELKKAMAQLLTPAAASRLSNVRSVKPQFALQVELYLLQLFQEGKLTAPLDEEKLKRILSNFVEKKETKIVRR